MDGRSVPEPRAGKLVRVNGVDLCVETFGDPADPAILLVGTTMLGWDEAFCQRLVAGRRLVIRYDIRDTGRSVSYPPGAPAYALRDLVADAAGVLDAFAAGRAHVGCFSAGGWIGQLLALDHPGRVSSLILISTRPTAPGSNDGDLPEHDEELMAYIMSTPQPDWSDRAAVLDYLVDRDRQFAGSFPFDEASRRAVAGRVYDRTTNMVSSLTNIAFIDHGDRWRSRLGQVSAPTLVIHGTEDRFFPIGNGQALADEIPGARLLAIERMGHELPEPAWDQIVPAILRHTS